MRWNISLMISMCVSLFCGFGNSTAEQNKSILYCNEWLSSARFTTDFSDVKNGFIYGSIRLNTGIPSDFESCIYDNDHPLHVNLERKEEISDLYINYRLLTMTHGEDTAAVYVTNELGSNQSNKQETGCTYNGTQLPNHEDYFMWRCSGTVYVDGVTIKSANRLNFQNLATNPAPWFYFEARMLHHPENKGGFCLPPWRYSSQQVEPVKQRYKIGNKVDYSCENIPNINSLRICSLFGRWSGTPPICSLSEEQNRDATRNGCPPIDPYVGMPDDLQDYHEEDVVEKIYSRPCRDGYAFLDYLPRLACENGTWNGENPVCKRLACGRPPDIANGQWNYSDPYYDVVTYSCRDGYQLDDASATNLECKQGNWTGDIPTCSYVTPNETQTVVIVIAAVVVVSVLVAAGLIGVRREKEKPAPPEENFYCEIKGGDYDTVEDSYLTPRSLHDTLSREPSYIDGCAIGHPPLPPSLYALEEGLPSSGGFLMHQLSRVDERRSSTADDEEQYDISIDDQSRTNEQLYADAIPGTHPQHSTSDAANG